MTHAVAPLTMIPFAAPTRKGEAETPRVYRLRKCFAVVQFDAGLKGRIVFLPQGAEVRIVGGSCLPECFEVAHEGRQYNIFKADLLGSWSSPIESRPIESSPIESRRIRRTRTLTTVGACA